MDLKDYFFDNKENTFLKVYKKNRTFHEKYEETSEHIKIIKSLISNNIKFEERDNGDIKIAF